MKIFLVPLFVLILTSCGGGSISPEPVIKKVGAATVVTPLPINTSGMEIIKPPTVQDGTAGGLSVLRNTTSLSGGSPTWVNAASYVHSLAGKNNTAIEWASLSVMDDYADFGQNVAVYAQTNKYGPGQSFGAVSEVSDITGFPGASVAHEFDVWTTGPDTGGRHGLYVVSGDAREIRGLGRSSIAEATSAIIVGQTTASPWASWKNGIELTGNFRESAIKLVAPNGQVMFEVKPNGDIYQRGKLVQLQ